MNRVPRRRLLGETSSLPLRPLEAFVFSRVDDVKDEHALAQTTGLELADVRAALERLAGLGAVELEGYSPPRESSSPLPPEATVEIARSEEAVDLDAKQQQRISELFGRLDELTYYELLGAAENADKRQLKNAYYATAPEFHPDKYFRKELGSFRRKIEAIFSRVTLAHDVLTSPDRRRDYDAYLDVTQSNRSMAAKLDAATQELEQALGAVEASANRAMSTPSQAPPGPAPRLLPETPAARRDAFARKILGRTPLPPSVRPTSVSRDAATSAAAEALRARYEAARASATRLQIERHLASARAAVEQRDPAAAAKAYRIAASLAPDDAELQRASAEASSAAANELAEGFLKQAEYEVANARWSAAALSYTRACEARPTDAGVHDRAAFATLQAAGNPRTAVALARMAVELEPSQAEFRVTLVQAYAAAGLTQSARLEGQRVIELGGGGSKIKELLAKLGG
jgi:curved DNA-binding protein CbpA